MPESQDNPQAKQQDSPGSQTVASSGKGKAFFDRADEVAQTGNWDFAIQLYLEGIRREPDNVERGHKPLWEVALKRKMEGGKPAGLLESLKRRSGKDPVDSLVNAEYFLAKDPGNISRMVAVLKAAQQIGAPALIKWICDILFEATRRAKRPNKRILVMLAKAYADIEEYASVVAATDEALKISPMDDELQEMSKDYSAKQTIQQGRYDTEGSFVESVRDLDKQIELAQRDQIVQSRDFLLKEVEKARAEYQANPNVPGKIDALVDALVKLEEPEFENEAIEVLQKAFEQTGMYRFKMRMDDIKARQMRRKYKQLKSEGKEQEALKVAKELLNFELEMYAERAKNYPTDLSIRYELGVREFTAGKIDEAITSFQKARQDPQHRISALTYLGQAFEKKGWYPEAINSYRAALEAEPSESRAKEIRYYLARALQATGQNAEALEQLSQIAQIDYNYRDVREQIERLRKQNSSK